MICFLALLLVYICASGMKQLRADLCTFTDQTDCGNAGCVWFNGECGTLSDAMDDGYLQDHGDRRNLKTPNVICALSPVWLPGCPQSDVEAMVDALGDLNQVLSPQLLPGGADISLHQGAPLQAPQVLVKVPASISKYECKLCKKLYDVVVNAVGSRIEKHAICGAAVTAACTSSIAASAVGTANAILPTFMATNCATMGMGICEILADQVSSYATNSGQYVCSLDRMSRRCPAPSGTSTLTSDLGCIESHHCPGMFVTVESQTDHSRNNIMLWGGCHSSAQWKIENGFVRRANDASRCMVKVGNDIKEGPCLDRQESKWIYRPETHQLLWQGDISKSMQKETFFCSNGNNLQLGDVGDSEDFKDTFGTWVKDVFAQVDNWYFCANQNEDCFCDGFVRIGNGDTWSRAKNVEGKISCTTSDVGDVNIGKQRCQCSTQTTQYRTSRFTQCFSYDTNFPGDDKQNPVWSVGSRTGQECAALCNDQSVKDPHGRTCVAFQHASKSFNSQATCYLSWQCDTGLKWSHGHTYIRKSFRDFTITQGLQYCGIDSQGCVTDGAGRYDNLEECTIKVNRRGMLVFEDFFHVEEPSWNGCVYDYLTVAGKKYCGSNIPEDMVVEAGSEMSWKTDYSISGHGWRICLTSTPGRRNMGYFPDSPERVTRKF